MNDQTRARLAGALAGAANGCFGGGGGMVFLPLMTRSGVPERQLYATCVGVIFPVCAVSAGVWYARTGFSLSRATPYLLGGLAGGFLGGRLYGRVPVGVLRWIFAAFLFYAAARYLW